MSYIIGSDGLLDFRGCETNEDKIDQCWEYFEENLASATIVAFDDKLVRGFTEKTFDHIISKSSNKYDDAIKHDIPFDEGRAKCLPLIEKVISGEVRSHCYQIAKKRGNVISKKKNLVVIEFGSKCYVVSMAEVRGEYRLLTAFPTNQEYVNRCIRGKGAHLGVWECL